LQANSSNYSAWHYRATLLPRVRPAKGMVISADCLVEEMEVFTIFSSKRFIRKKKS
jgi:hypothetical protein